MSEGQGQVTLLLRAWKGGRSEAFDQLIPLVYNELSRIAHGHLRRAQRTPTLDTGVLVNEAYLKLAAQEGLDARDRGHFLAVAARAMRQVLIDLARARQAEKRGAGEVAVPRMAPPHERCASPGGVRSLEGSSVGAAFMTPGSLL